MAGIRVEGGSGNVALVDAYGNLLTTGPQDVDQSGYVNVVGEASAPSEPAGVMRRPIEGTADYALRVGIDTLLLNATFAGSATSANAIQQDVWKQTATTMTASAGSTVSGFLQLNASNITTVTTGIQYQTYAVYPALACYPTYYEFEARTVNGGSASGKVIELGLGLTTDAKTAGLLDGIAFRWTAAGEFRGVISINGVETITSALPIPTDNVVHRFTITYNVDWVTFWVDNEAQARLQVPSNAVGPTLQPNLPVLMRIYNNVAPSLAARLEVATVYVSQGSTNYQKPWAAVCSGMGQHASNVPYGTAVGETTNGANASALPSAAAGSNTAAMTGCTTLGGFAQMNAQAGSVAAAGDMIMFSYQVPAQTATQGSKRLAILGVRISTVNLGAAVATTATVLLFGLAWGHTAVSLATADAVGAKAPRHLKVGIQSAAIGTAIGQVYSPENLMMQFGTPIFVNPGEFIAVTCRFLVGTATASQVVGCSCGFDGYWE